MKSDPLASLPAGLDRDAASRAVQHVARLSDAEVITELRKGRASWTAEAWWALERAFAVRGLRFPPWDDPELVLCTTAPDLAGYRITQTIDVISAEAVLGVGFLREFVATLSDEYGGRSHVIESKLADGKRAVMDELRAQARALRADAVIGVDLDYSEFSGQGKSMLFLVATGTAVQVERLEGTPMPVRPGQRRHRLPK